MNERCPQPNNPNRPTRAASHSPTPGHEPREEANIINATVTEQVPQPNSGERSTRAASAYPGPGYVPIDDHNALYGRELRYVLTDYISRGYRTINELIHKLAQDGHTLWGRASKVISDALRWEIRNQRIRRIRRGVYATDTIPRTTMHRITTHSHTLFFAPHAVATRRTTRTTSPPQPPPPPDRYWQQWRKSRPNPRFTWSK